MKEILGVPVRSGVARGSPRWTWLWLAVGAAFMVFSNGRWAVFVAAWAASVFMLRFTRGMKPGAGLAIGGLVSAASYMVSWRGAIPVNGVALYCLIAGSIGVLYWLPYVADRFFAPRIKGFLSTLVFPLACVTMDLVSLLASPYLTWGSVAYTQYDLLPFAQLASLTGLPGIVFMVSWFGAVVNWAWEQSFSWERVRAGVLVYSALIAAVLSYGGARLAWRGPQGRTVRVAGLTLSEGMTDIWMNGLLNPGTIDTHSQTVLDDYVSRTRLVSGARIVSWDEGAILVSPAKEADAVRQGRELAKEKGIYLLLPLLVVPADGKSPAEDKAVLIDPEGGVVFEYLKSVVVPGDDQLRGEGPLPTADVPAGRIGAAICFDLDDPRIIRRAGRSRVGLLLAPSDDWAAVDPLHSRMACFRSIENGFSLFRPAREAVSVAYDGLGRPLASMAAAVRDRVMIAELPMTPAWTLYPIVGDLFAWAGAGGLAVMIWMGLSGGGRTRSAQSAFKDIIK